MLHVFYSAYILPYFALFCLYFADIFVFLASPNIARSALFFHNYTQIVILLYILLLFYAHCCCTFSTLSVCFSATAILAYISAIATQQDWAIFLRYISFLYYFGLKKFYSWCFAPLCPLNAQFVFLAFVRYIHNFGATTFTSYIPVSEFFRLNLYAFLSF